MFTPNWQITDEKMHTERMHFFVKYVTSKKRTEVRREFRTIRFPMRVRKPKLCSPSYILITAVNKHFLEETQQVLFRDIKFNEDNQTPVTLLFLPEYHQSDASKNKRYIFKKNTVVTEKHVYQKSEGRKLAQFLL